MDFVFTIQLLPDQASLLERTKAEICNPLGNLQSAYKSILVSDIWIKVAYCIKSMYDACMHQGYHHRPPSYNQLSATHLVGYSTISYPTGAHGKILLNFRELSLNVLIMKDQDMCGPWTTSGLTP